MCFLVVAQAQWGEIVLTCDGAHSWQLYSAASLEQQATSSMSCYLTQSQYPDSELTSPCPILIMPSIRLGSDKYQFKSHWFDSTKVRKLRGPESNLQPSDSPIFQNGRQAFYSFGHRDWSPAILYSMDGKVKHI